MNQPATHPWPELPPLREQTLPWMVKRQLARAPDKLAVRDSQRALSYAQLFEEALSLAGGFAALGVSRQEPVLLMLDNHAEFLSLWWALGLTARIEAPVNTGYKGSILAHVINNSKARVMVLEAQYLPLLDDIAERLSTLETIIVRGQGPTPARLGRLRRLDLPQLYGPRAQPEDVQPWDLIGYMYTSGTTGPSKGVRVTHAHAYSYSAPSVLTATTDNDVSLCMLPLFHIGGQWAIVYNAMIAGGSSVVLPRFSATAFWDDVRLYGCTHTLMLGVMANFLWQQPPRADDADHPMKRVLMVPVVPQLEEFKRRFGIEDVGTAYGLTEGSTITTASGSMTRPGAVGLPRGDFEVRIVDEHDCEVPRGVVGELVVRARVPWQVMDGYHEMPEATVKTWRNQWLHTGDALRIDDDGQYVFIDRQKDAIRRRGENISSFEVEKEILEFPSVLEVAVIAVPSDATEDEIMACLMARQGATIDVPALAAFLQERMPKFMVPRYFEVMDAFPRTPTEKIQKQVLRDRGMTAATVDMAPTGGRRAKV